MVTAASELARNTLDLRRRRHGAARGAGRTAPGKGLRLTFEDQGPGIADIELALTDGYTTGNGLGLGLSGARRLVNEFEHRLAGRARAPASRVTRWK